MRTKSILSVLVSAVILLAACNQAGNTNKKPAEEQPSEKEQAFEELAKYPIPTSFDIIGLLSKAGAGYIISINNPTDNIDKYFTETSKALNLGAYGADLSYASTYHMKQETRNYMKVCKQLVEELSITKGFNAELAQSVEKNIEDKDKLIQIISDACFDSYEFLVNNGKDNLSVFVLIGSWVEGMYLTTQIAYLSEENADFKEIIKNQVAPIEKLIEIMENHKDNEKIAEYLVTFKELKTEFTALNEQFTDDDLKKVVQRIDVLRTEIVE